MAESTGLLNLRLGNWSEGSNPSLSAIFKLKNARKVPFSTVSGFFSSRFVYGGYIRLIRKKNRDMAVAKIKLDLGARKAISLKNPEPERSSERSKETDSAIESNLNGSYPVHVQQARGFVTPERICRSPKHGPSMRRVPNAPPLIQ